MADSDTESGAQRDALRRIEALVTRLAWRVRAQRALEWATTAAVVALLCWMVALALHKTGWMSWEVLREVGMGCAGLVALIAALGAAMRLDPIKLAQRIDRSHALHDRLSTALALARTPAQAQEEDAAFRAAQLEDAGRHTSGVELKRAAPWRWPQELALCMAVLVCAVGLHVVRAPSHKRAIAPITIKIEHHRILDKATVQLERERIDQLRELVKNSDDPHAKELIEELDALLDEVEAQKISEKEFLGKLDAIQEKLIDKYKEQDSQLAELREKLKEAAEELEKEAAKELKDQKEVAALVDALKKEDMKGAQQALDKLADKLKSEDLSTKDLEQLAKLMEKFGDKIDPTDPKLKKLFEENESKLKDLIAKLEKKGDKLSDEEKQRLNRAKEDLEKLAKDREGAGGQDQTSRQLKQLKREADEMAKKMREEAKDKKNVKKKDEKAHEQGGKPNYRQEAANKAKQAANQAGEQDKQQKGEQARKDAQKQLEELRESMQRQRGRGEQQDKQQEEQVEDFMRRAQGKEQQDQGQDKPGQKGQQGKDGQPKPGQDQDGKDGQQGKDKQAGQDGKDGKDSKDGQQGKDGQDAQSGKKTEGQDGKKGKGESGDAPGEGKEGEEPSDSAGKGEGSRELGEETDLKGKRVDSKVEGKQLKQGQSRSEIIKSASEKGFATRQYKDVYGDYSSVVEEVMEKENVPKGYRYYVKRYFQLIKPRGQE
jgi:hypothetical protein